MTTVHHNPGSTGAVELGCTCPVSDNHYGNGIPINEGNNRRWWITAGCPVHDPARAFTLEDAE